MRVDVEGIHQRHAQPAAPSTRVTEAELQSVEGVRDGFGGAFVRSNDLRLVREVRRYRALLIGLAGQTGWQPYCCACVFCNNSDPGKHYEDCCWPALEAEVQAIRAERKP